MNGVDPSVWHRFIGPSRLLIRIAGASPEQLATCPRRDVDLVLVIGALMLLVFTWQAILFALVAHQMLAEPGVIRPELVGIGILLAALVLLMDSAMIMRPSWTAHGVEELRRHGIEIAHGFGRLLKAAFFTLLRIMIAFVVAMLIGLFVCGLIFEKSTTREFEKEFLSQNARVISEAGARFDANLKTVDAAASAATATITGLREQERNLRLVIVNPGSEDPELKPLLERIDRLEQVKLAANQDFTAAQTAVTRTRRRSSSRRAAEWRAVVAQRAATTAATALRDTQNQLAELRKTLSAGADARRSAAEARLEQVLGEKAAQQKRLEGLEDERARLVANRDQAIQAAVESDPNYVRKDQGFLGRVRALKRLADNDPLTKWVVILFDVVFFVIELAAVLSKITVLVPSTYATRIACEDYMESARTAADIREEIAQLEGNDAPFVPEGPAAGQTAAPPITPEAEESGAEESLVSRLNKMNGGTPPMAEQSPEPEAPAAAEGPFAVPPTPNAQASPGPKAMPGRRRGRPPGKKWQPPRWVAEGEHLMKPQPERESEADKEHERNQDIEDGKSE